MSMGSKCKSCGSSDLEVDLSRGDTVCTNCGTVLEDSIIVSEVQFQEISPGIKSAIGQFVPSDSSVSVFRCRGFGNSSYFGRVRESREVTLDNAKRTIINLSQSLRLNQHCIDTAFNLYKMALDRHFTGGRQHVAEACVYITCRIEGTPHLLIDFSDFPEICLFELSQTYLQLTQFLSINIPFLDPCQFVLRFASKLEFGDKTHEVTMTALRFVKRMKMMSMHYGRRPSGICGAALFLAAREHACDKTVGDIASAVQVHERTLKKRLVEFGEIPRDLETQIMTVDLEEEQDPPSYKAARAKDEQLIGSEDKERLERLKRLQSAIVKHILEKNKQKSTLDELTSQSEDSPTNDERDLKNFIPEPTLDVLENIEDEDLVQEIAENMGRSPNVERMGLGESRELSGPSAFEHVADGGELDLEGLDDNELDGYIMTEGESKLKVDIWTRNNADYLKAVQEKEEILKKELEEGKPPVTKKINKKKTSETSANSAKMLPEKKMSSKINYDALKSLSINLKLDGVTAKILSSIIKEQTLDEKNTKLQNEEISSSQATPPKASKKEDPPTPEKQPVIPQPMEIQEDTDLEDDEYDDEDVGGRAGVLSVAQMLSQYNGEDDSGGGGFYDYDEDDY